MFANINKGELNNVCRNRVKNVHKNTTKYCHRVRGLLKAKNKINNEAIHRRTGVHYLQSFRAWLNFMLHRKNYIENKIMKNVMCAMRAMRLSSKCAQSSI